MSNKVQKINRGHETAKKIFAILPKATQLLLKDQHNNDMIGCGSNIFQECICKSYTNRTAIITELCFNDHCRKFCIEDEFKRMHLRSKLQKRMIFYYDENELLRYESTIRGIANSNNPLFNEADYNAIFRSSGRQERIVALLKLSVWICENATSNSPHPFITLRFRQISKMAIIGLQEEFNEAHINEIVTNNDSVYPIVN